MRIAMLSWEARHAVLVGGVAAHVFDLAAALAGMGHETHVFTRMGPGQRLYDDVFGVHVHRCPFEPLANFVDEMTTRMAPSFLHYFGEAEERFGPFDVVHCHDWLALPAGLRIKADGRARLAVTFHTTEWGRSGEWPKEGDALRITEIEREGVDAADAVLAVSQAVRRELENLHRCPDWKSSVIYHGIDLARFDRATADPGEVKKSMGLDPMAPTVLFVGRLVYRKGPDVLMQAAPGILEKKPDARFVFVGEGELEEHLRREAERFGIADAVSLPGWLPTADLVNLYRSCDLVCAPGRADPFGVVPLSAWAAGKPVVAARAGSTGEFVMHGTNGLLVDPEPDAVTGAVLSLFDDFDRLRWMGRNGRVAAETAFSWDAVADKALKAYSIGPDPTASS